MVTGSAGLPDPGRDDRSIRLIETDGWRKVTTKGSHRRGLIAHAVKLFELFLMHPPFRLRGGAVGGAVVNRYARPHLLSVGHRHGSELEWML